MAQNCSISINKLLAAMARFLHEQTNHTSFSDLTAQNFLPPLLLMYYTPASCSGTASGNFLAFHQLNPWIWKNSDCNTSCSIKGALCEEEENWGMNNFAVQTYLQPWEVLHNCWLWGAVCTLHAAIIKPTVWSKIIELWLEFFWELYQDLVYYLMGWDIVLFKPATLGSVNSVCILLPYEVL